MPACKKALRLFTWKSSYLKEYRTGTIAVCAESPDAGRSLARQEFERHVRDRYDYLWQDGQPLDEDSAEQIAEYRRLFEADIDAEPVVVAGCLFIAGSE